MDEHRPAARRSPRPTRPSPSRASSTSAMACSTPRCVSQKNVVFATWPCAPAGAPHALQEGRHRARRVRPGSTRSRSPTSMPSSSVDVQTMQAFGAVVELLLGDRARSSRETALWWTKTVVPARRMCSATASVGRARLAEEQALLARARARGLVGEVADALGRCTTASCASAGRLRRVHDDASRLRRALEPRQDRIRVADGRAEARRAGRRSG